MLVAGLPLRGNAEQEDPNKITQQFVSIMFNQINYKQ